MICKCLILKHINAYLCTSLAFVIIIIITAHKCFIYVRPLYFENVKFSIIVGLCRSLAFLVVTCSFKNVKSVYPFLTFLTRFTLF